MQCLLVLFHGSVICNNLAHAFFFDEILLGYTHLADLMHGCVHSGKLEFSDCMGSVGDGTIPLNLPR